MRIGVDLGGSKIAAVLMDDAGGVTERSRIETPRGSADTILDAVATVVRQLENRAGVSCNVGIGTPGSISPVTGLLRNSNTTELNGVPVMERLQHRLQRALRIANDADCFALSEAQHGAAAGMRSVFGVILGTGVGGGLVIDGRLLQGSNGIAGEWGHNRLSDPLTDTADVQTCYCGRNGCVETYLCGPALSAQYRRTTGDNLTAMQVSDLADSGDPAAEKLIQRYETRLAAALAQVINIVDPQAIVLGGGLSNIQRLYQNVPRLWPQYVFSDHITTRLLPPRYGDDSGVLGAARLWPPGA